MIETKRRGISTFIATLLLMVLAVSAGVVIYAYTMGYLGSFGGPQTMGAISIDTSSLNPLATAGNPAVTAYIRNIGKTTFIPQNVYVDGIAVKTRDVDPNYGWAFTGPTTADRIAETEVGILEIDQASLKDGGTLTFVGSRTYEIKIVGKDNTQLSFQVKK